MRQRLTLNHELSLLVRRFGCAWPACLLGFWWWRGWDVTTSVIEHLLHGRGEETRVGRSRRRLRTRWRRYRRTGGAPDGAAGGGGQGPAPGVACGPLSLSSTIVLAPAAAGQNYVRCQTLGPETGWQVTLSPTGRSTGGADGRRDLAPPRHRHLDRARAARLAAGGDRRGRLLARRRDAGDALRGDGRGRALERARRRVRAQLRRAGGLRGRHHRAALAFSSDSGRLATSLGTMIDLGSGATTSWLTGAPQNARWRSTRRTSASARRVAVSR